MAHEIHSTHLSGTTMPSWFGFLRIEADLAMTFIKIASASNSERSARYLGNARKTLAEIQRGLMEPAFYGLSEYQILFLEQYRAEIDIALGGIDSVLPGRGLRRPLNVRVGSFVWVDFVNGNFTYSMCWRLAV